MTPSQVFGIVAASVAFVAILVAIGTAVAALLVEINDDEKEGESITPKPDPDWKDICAKCKDGDIEPKHCEYYGEPNGCNSPIYGEHPTAEKSSAVGDCAKLREALKAAELGLFRWLSGSISRDEHRELVATIKTALAATPRNCDRFASAEEAWDAYDEWVESYRAKGEIPPFNEFGWLFAPATEKEGGAK